MLAFVLSSHPLTMVIADYFMMAWFLAAIYWVVFPTDPARPARSTSLLAILPAEDVLRGARDVLALHHHLGGGCCRHLLPHSWVAPLGSSSLGVHRGDGHCGTPG